MKYNWTNAHPDTRWIATDSNGYKCEFSKKPYMNACQWLADNLNDIARTHQSSEFTGDWKDSLEERE